MLKLLKKDLGLAETALLDARLHNLLIYELGQFFNYHQDSEKLEGMVATLIIVLPSAHKGGTLTIDNQGDKKQFHSSRFPLDKLSFIAFYADCHHEITKLTEGYRCVLTYNLTLENNTQTRQTNNQKPNAKLTQSLRQYFINAQNVNTNAARATSPVKYVYLLDHAYTEKGLSWKHLKNSDAIRAEALKIAFGHLSGTC